MIADPDRIQIPAYTEIKPDIEILKAKNEIGGTLDSVDFDKEALRWKMLRRLSLKYKSIDPAHLYHIEDESGLKEIKPAF